MIVLADELPGGASPLASAVYPVLAPLAAGAAADASRGWPLGHYLAALLEPVRVSVLVSEEPSVLLDVDRAPAQLLSAVEQSTGTVVDRRLDDALRRDRVRRHAAERFGRPAEIRAAVAETLEPVAGEALVVRLRERHDPTRPDLHKLGPEARFHLTVVTRTAQTPDPELTAARAQAAAPHRTLVHHVMSTGRTIDELTGSIDDLTGPISEL